MKKLIISIIAILTALAGIGGYTIVKKNETRNFDNRLHEVLTVIDGDTVKIENNIRVRLLGIDAPEKGECFYKESKNFLTDFLEGKQVKLEKDISGKDRFDRLLRYIVLPNQDPEQDNILINDLLLRQGYVLHTPIPPDNRYRDLFSSAQQNAKKNNKGLWGVCEIPESETSALREKDSLPPNPSCIIKGNISEKGYGKTYLIPGCDNYNSVKIDIRKGEQYFCSEAEAQAAGFRKATNCPDK